MGPSKDELMKLSKSNKPPPPNPQIRHGKIESSLVRKPTHGVFPWWPEEGTDWIHADDIELAQKVIPGRRIFRREDIEGGMLLVTYGKIQLRIHPVMWLEVPEPDYRVGDHVEIKSKLGKVEPKIAEVSEVYWDRYKRRAEYHLVHLGKPLPGAYTPDSLSPTATLGNHIPVRHLGKKKSLRFQSE